MSLKKINGQISLIRLGGLESNIYVINNELLVDAGTGFHEKAVIQALNDAGIVIEDIRRIVLTHAHFDHFGGAGLFKDAKVGVHRDDSKAIEAGNSPESLAHMFAARPKAKKIDFLLDDSDVLISGETKLKVIHTPGHTKGSICLLDEANKILISGDTVFASGFGRMDFPGGNPEEMRETLKRLSMLEVETILPGHGDIVWGGGSGVIKRMLKG